jgi:cyanate lyase
MIPLCGSIDDRVPTDPTIYRFYEILQVWLYAEGAGA